MRRFLGAGSRWGSGVDAGSYDVLTNGGGAVECAASFRHGAAGVESWRGMLRSVDKRRSRCRMRGSLRRAAIFGSGWEGFEIKNFKNFLTCRSAVLKLSVSLGG